MSVTPGCQRLAGDDGVVDRRRGREDDGKERVQRAAIIRGATCACVGLRASVVTMAVGALGDFLMLMGLVVAGMRDDSPGSRTGLRERRRNHPGELGDQKQGDQEPKIACVFVRNHGIRFILCQRKFSLRRSALAVNLVERLRLVFLRRNDALTWARKACFAHRRWFTICEGLDSCEAAAAQLYNFQWLARTFGRAIFLLFARVGIADCS